MGLSAGTPSAARPPEPIPVRLPITVGQFLKVSGIVATGGEAKQLIAMGQVQVNGRTQTRRGHHLMSGDVVAVSGQAFVVAHDTDHRS